MEHLKNLHKSRSEEARYVMVAIGVTLFCVLIAVLLHRWRKDPIDFRVICVGNKRFVAVMEYKRVISIVQIMPPEICERTEP